MVAVGWGYHADFGPHSPNPFQAVLCRLSPSVWTITPRVPNLVYKNGHHRFDFWISLKNHLLYQSVLAPHLCIFFSASSPASLPHPSPAYPTPSRSLSLSLLLCLAVPGLIYLARCSRASGKAPGYICRLLRLDLLHGGWLWILCLGLPARTCASCLLSICFALNKELVRHFVWQFHIPEFYCQHKWTSSVKHFSQPLIIGAKAL